MALWFPSFLQAIWKAPKVCGHFNFLLVFVISFPASRGLSRREKNVSEEEAKDGGLARYIKLSAKG